MFETLSDPVDMLTAYVDGRVQPLRFRWRGRVIRIKSVTGEWSRREGATVIQCYAVEGHASDTYELSYDPRSSRWVLARAWSG